MKIIRLKKFAGLTVLVVIVLILDCVYTDDAVKQSTSAPSGETVALSKQLPDEKLFPSLIKSLINLASNGFKSGLEASMRSIFEKPLSTAVAAVSMIIGAVAVLAFYESPISPLPVPPLPDPPVGRFPPEHPIWPPPRGQQAGGHNKKPMGMMMAASTNSGPASNFANFLNPMMNGYHRSDDSRMPPLMPMHPMMPSTNQYQQAKLMKNSMPITSIPNHHRVIDYANKRLALEMMKMKSENTTTTLPSST